MKIEIGKIGPDGTRYEGEEPQEILELENDAYAKVDGAVRYNLHADKVGSELIVRGELVAPLKLLCGRCGDFFSTTLEVLSFLRAYEISNGQEEVDLTQDIREDILLELPGFPKCSWLGKGVCPYSGVDVSKLKLPEVTVSDDRWAALDGLDSAQVTKSEKRKTKARKA